MNTHSSILTNLVAFLSLVILMLMSLSTKGYSQVTNQTDPKCSTANVPKTIATGAAFTLNMFQQQIKPEIGGERGERLTYNVGIGLDLHAYYIVNEYIEIGGFLRYDNGFRRAAIFDSISPGGTAITTGVIEGKFNEIWLGPRLLLRYGGLFGEFGWGLWGTRLDHSRNDIPAADESIAESFDLNPAFAMQLNIGYELALCKNISALAKLEWRLRYYDGRGGQQLVSEIEHGTMNINPFIGICYRL